MKDKISLCIVLTMAALLACLGMAEAQETQAIGTGTLTDEGTPIGSGKLTDEGTPEVTPFAVIGWYYVHPSWCNTYYDGVTTWLYIYPQEGGFWVTANLVAQITIAPACQTGNKIAFYVFNTSGNFNQVALHTYK